MAAGEDQKHLSASSPDSGSEDECPNLEEEEGQQDDGEDGGSPGGRNKQSRNEKKARKAVLRHGMRHMPGIVRVMIRKSKHVRKHGGGEERTNVVECRTVLLTFSLFFRGSESLKGLTVVSSFLVD